MRVVRAEQQNAKVINHCLFSIFWRRAFAMEGWGMQTMHCSNTVFFSYCPQAKCRGSSHRLRVASPTETDLPSPSSNGRRNFCFESEILPVAVVSRFAPLCDSAERPPLRPIKATHAPGTWIVYLPGRLLCKITSRTVSRSFNHPLARLPLTAFVSDAQRDYDESA